MGLQDAKTSKVERAATGKGTWDFYYNYWTCNIVPGNKYIIQISKQNNAVIYPYTKPDMQSNEDFTSLTWMIDGISTMYAGNYHKMWNYRPASETFSRMKAAQNWFDKRTTGWYERGRKPDWLKKTSYYIRSYSDTKYRFEDD